MYREDLGPSGSPFDVMKPLIPEWRKKEKHSITFQNNSSRPQECLETISTITHGNVSVLYTSDVYTGRKEGNVLFNDALNTFYLRLYGVRHMVKDHSDSERGNPLPPHKLLFPISSKGSFICIIPQTG